DPSWFGDVGSLQRCKLKTALEPLAATGCGLMVVHSSVFLAEPAAPAGITIIASAATISNTPIAAPPRKTGFLRSRFCVRYQRLISSLPLTDHWQRAAGSRQTTTLKPSPGFSFRGRRGTRVAGRVLQNRTSLRTLAREVKGLCVRRDFRSETPITLM